MVPSKVIGCVPSINVHLSCIRVAQPVVQVFPLPVEGAETKVLADDQEVANYMIDLGDLLETVSSSLFSIFPQRTAMLEAAGPSFSGSEANRACKTRSWRRVL